MSVIERKAASGAALNALYDDVRYQTPDLTPRPPAVGERALVLPYPWLPGPRYYPKFAAWKTEWINLGWRFVAAMHHTSTITCHLEVGDEHYVPTFDQGATA